MIGGDQKKYIDILTRGTNSPSVSGYTALYKYRPTGELLAQTSFYDFLEINTVKTVIQTQNYGYALIGDYPGDLVMNYGRNGLVLKKLDQSFSSAWTQMYPFHNDPNNFMVSDSLAETPGGNFALLGHLMLNCGSPAFNMDTALYGADINGSLQWQLSFDIAPREYPCFVYAASDGSYFIGGRLSTAEGSTSAYLVKLK
jgi:hypothetical protein